MTATAKEKRFDREIESLRALIQSKAKPFADDKKAQKERVVLAKTDLEFFGKTYFPHYLDTPPSALHKYFCNRYPIMIARAIDTGTGDREADAAPRGNAKSTWITLILSPGAIIYIVFSRCVSETALQAQDFICSLKQN